MSNNKSFEVFIPYATSKVNADILKILSSSMSKKRTLAGRNNSLEIVVSGKYDLSDSEYLDTPDEYYIEDFDKVLSLDLLENENAQESSDVDSEMEQYINEMISKRAEAKKAKDFATADAIREELAAKGIVLKDTREGVVIIWE